MNIPRKAQIGTAVLLAALFTLVALGYMRAAQPLAAQPAPGRAAMPAAPAANIGLMDRLGGASNAVALHGRFAFVGEGAQLTILDVTDRAAPLLVAKSRPLAGVISHVVTSGDVVYILARGDLFTLDAADPAAPQLVGYYDLQGGGQDLALDGDYAYVAGGASGLHILDVRNPVAVAAAGHYDGPAAVSRVSVSGGMAYLATDVLRILDVNDPAAPVEIAAQAFCNGIEITDVAAADEYVFLTGHVTDEYIMGGFCVVRVSDPANPVEVALRGAPNGTYAVDLAGDLAFVSGGGGNTRLFIFDISQPRWTRLRAEYTMPGWPAATVVADDTAYVAAAGGGLRILDIGTPDAPLETGYYQPLGLASELALEGSYAYVAGDMALGVVDVSDAGTLEATAVLNMPREDSLAGALGVDVAGELAAVALGWDGVRLIDVRDPAAPTAVGQATVGGAIYDVALAGNYAYLADRGSAHYNDGLRILDLTDPAVPAAAGFLDTPGWATGVDLAGTTAYVADGAAGLRIVDVADPQQPIESGYVTTPGFAWDVTASGATAYVAESSGGLAVVDLATPAALGHVEFTGAVWAAAAEGALVYAAAGASGLRVLDVSDPAHPREIAYYDTPGTATDVALSGGDILVADREGGLLRLRYLPWRVFAPLSLGGLP